MLMRQRSGWKVRMRVYDRWWSWRTGTITRIYKTRIHVKWHDTGEYWIYDHAHEQFLERITS